MTEFYEIESMAVKRAVILQLILAFMEHYGVWTQIKPKKARKKFQGLIEQMTIDVFGGLQWEDYSSDFCGEELTHKGLHSQFHEFEEILSHMKVSNDFTDHALGMLRGFFDANDNADNIFGPFYSVGELHEIANRTLRFMREQEALKFAKTWHKQRGIDVEWQRTHVVRICEIHRKSFKDDLQEAYLEMHENWKSWINETALWYQKLELISSRGHIDPSILEVYCGKRPEWSCFIPDPPPLTRNQKKQAREVKRRVRRAEELERWRADMKERREWKARQQDDST